MIRVRVATKQGYTLLNEGGVADLSYPSSQTRRGRVVNMGDVSPTICTGENDLCRVESMYRIRKLTPKECWRLMGFTDEDFEAAAGVNSNTQLYKQAGNSIVKDVLMGIFSQMVGWKPGDKVIYSCNDEAYYNPQAKTKHYQGVVKEVYENHIIVDIPWISDHMWFDKDNMESLQKVKG